MGRPHIEFIHSWEAPRSAVPDGAFAGLERRVLSEDDETGAYTALLSVPQGWSGDLGGAHRRMELLCLRGALDVAARGFGDGCYADIPAWADPAPAGAPLDALALLMVEDVA